jgi:hypothetical protein
MHVVILVLARHRVGVIKYRGDTDVIRVDALVNARLTRREGKREEEQRVGYALAIKIR